MSMIGNRSSMCRAMNRRGMTGKEVEAHVALVAVAEVGHGVLRPLVRLGEQHLVAELLVDVPAELAEERVGFRQVFAVRALALEEVRHCVEAEPVDSEAEPEVEDLEHLAPDVGAVVVQVGLVRVEAVPVVGLGGGVPGPIRGLKVLEDHAGFRVLFGRIAPHVVVAPSAAGRRAAGALEPGVLIGGMVEHQLGDHPQAPPVRLAQEELEILERAAVRVHVGVVGDVVPVVAQRGRVERKEPEGGHAQVLKVVEAAGEAAEIAETVAVAVLESTDPEFVDDCVLVPQGVAFQRGTPRNSLRHGVHWK